MRSRYSRYVDWDEFDAGALFALVRDRGPAADAEHTVWAFERALAIARTDSALVEHVLVACVSLLAFEREETPRTVLDAIFRRAIGDREWRERYAQLIG